MRNSLIEDGYKGKKFLVNFEYIIQVKTWSFSTSLNISGHFRFDPSKSVYLSILQSLNSLARPFFLTMSTQLLDIVKRDDVKETPVPAMKYVR